MTSEVIEKKIDDELDDEFTAKVRAAIVETGNAFEDKVWKDVSYDLKINVHNFTYKYRHQEFCVLRDCREDAIRRAYTNPLPILEICYNNTEVLPNAQGRLRREILGEGYIPLMRSRSVATPNR